MSSGSGDLSSLSEYTIPGAFVISLVFRCDDAGFVVKFTVSVLDCFLAN